MFERFSRKTIAATGATCLAALGFGGAAIAATNGTAAQEKPGVESTAPENSATDKDNVQYTAPGDPSGAGQVNGTKKAAAASSAAETPGTEQAAASETPGAAEQPGSETGTASDGPGGHADEPGNPNADHQFQGNE